MGKPNSFLYCRMHDMKDIIWPDRERGITMLMAFIPKIMEDFAMMHPEFPAKDAALAMSNGLEIPRGSGRCGKDD